MVYNCIIKDMKLYIISCPFRRKNYQFVPYTLKEALDFTSGKTSELSPESDDLYEVVQGKKSPNKKLVFWNNSGTGPKVQPIMRVAMAQTYLLSENAYLIMREADLKGWQGAQVRVMKSRPKAEFQGSPYYILQIMSNVPVGFSSEYIDSSGQAQRTGLKLDFTKYDGSDIFFLFPIGAICVTEKWKKVFDEHFPKLFTFTPIEEYTAPVV